MNLGINIDHIAVLREARKINDPDILNSLFIVKMAGANQITIHLREDRRHIQDNDLKNIINLSQLPVNVETALSKEVLNIILKEKPHRITIVPEKREEITTEGGLNIFKYENKIIETVELFHKNEIQVSLFIDPLSKNIKQAKKLKVDWIEFHTGYYANIYAMLYTNISKTIYSIANLDLSRDILKKKLFEEVENIRILTKQAKELNINVAVGHGLNYENINLISKIKDIKELNIGQSIIARSIFTGLKQAVIDMKNLIK